MVDIRFQAAGVANDRFNWRTVLSQKVSAGGITGMQDDPERRALWDGDSQPPNKGGLN